jgi:tetratricopeptide (TPR) repeat protein
LVRRWLAVGLLRLAASLALMLVSQAAAAQEGPFAPTDLTDQVDRAELAGLEEAVEPVSAVPELPPAPLGEPFVSSEVRARFGDRPEYARGGQPRGGYRSEIERTWFESRDSLAARATQTRVLALELGAENLEGPAMALIASPDSGGELTGAMLAARLAPDLPLARMAEARAHWSEGEYTTALSAAWGGILAIPRHLEGSLWVVGSLLMIIGVVLTIGSMTFIGVVGASVLHHATHDVGDWLSSSMPSFSRAALVASLLLLPVVLGEGAAGLTLGLLAVGFVYAGSRMRMAMTLAAALIVIGAYPVMRLAGVALTAFDGDPVAVATYATIQGIESPRDLALLERVSVDDPLAAEALAIHARRSGRNALAFARYRALLASRPRDFVALANLGNLHFGAGETDEAIDAYERAAALQDSATVMFNLSQAFARSFRMEEFETAMEEAQGFDPERVAMLSGIRTADFVADVPIALNEVRDRMLSAASGEALSTDWVARIAPGRLGTHYAAMGGAFALVAMLGSLLGGRFEHSSRCGRCGRRICTRCDGTVWSSEMCDPCHNLFNRPENTDAALRDARIAVLRERERRVARYETLAAVLIPGAGGVLARRPDLGIVGVLLFAFAVASIVWHRGVVPDPLAVGAAGSLALLMGAVLAAFAYFVVVLTSLVIRRRS